jgi:hypothetical protein
MKKILLLLLLLPCMASAGQYLETFDGVKVRARQKLNVSSSASYLTDTAFANYIRDGMVEVNTVMGAIVTPSVITTGVNVNTYSLDSLTVKILSVEWSENDSVKALEFVPRRMWAEKNHKSTVGEAGWLKIPSYYDNTETQIAIHPPPSRSGDTIKIISEKRIGNIDTVSTLSAIPEKYRVAVLRYVVWQAAEDMGHERAAEFKAAYDRTVANLLAIYGRGGQGIAKTDQ